MLKAALLAAALTAFYVAAAHAQYTGPAHSPTTGWRPVPPLTFSPPSSHIGGR